MTVTDPGQMQDFHKALKLKYPTATHVFCALQTLELFNLKEQITLTMVTTVVAGNYNGHWITPKKQNTCIFLSRILLRSNTGPLQIQSIQEVALEALNLRNW